MTARNAFVLALLVMLTLGSSPEVVNQEYLIAEIVLAKEIHEAYLEIPERDVTGSHEWHARWVATYTLVIRELGD